MMNKLKNFVANIPFVVGLAFKKLSDMFYNIAFKLHVTFNTEAGKKLKELNEVFKLMSQLDNAPKKHDPDAKLATIIKGDVNASQQFSAFGISKKPTKTDS